MGEAEGLDTEIEVSPTKALFVEMLTRDIALGRAVIDLVDNSVDGARKLRPGRGVDLSGLFVHLKLGDEEFRIKDNCGGIGIDLATKHAFRIGRPKGMPATPNSVGQFGVGMKRALFKFGRWFSVASTTTTDRFTLEVDVDEWEAEDGSWRFQFSSAERGIQVPVEDTGTEIVVTRLRDGVGASFGFKGFVNALEREIAAAQQEYLGRGLAILVNRQALIPRPWQLLRGGGIEPSMETADVAYGGAHVGLRIYAGLAEPSPSAAGWYVVCNGRMILEADQTAVTGWGRSAETKEMVAPKYHNTFARFRGYAFFDSEQAGLLPWNTTKTGVDSDSPLFQVAQGKMVQALRPVLDFLRRLDEEREAPEGERVLLPAIAAAQPCLVRDITRVGAFEHPTEAPRVGPRTRSIQYSRPVDQIEALQEALGASSAREVGMMSFDLAYKRHAGS